MEYAVAPSMQQLDPEHQFPKVVFQPYGMVHG